MLRMINRPAAAAHAISSFGEVLRQGGLHCSRSYRFVWGDVRASHVCSWQILLQKSFWGGERKFLEPLMRFARGDVRDHIVHPKSITGLRNGVEKRRSSREVQRSTLARFLG